MYVKEEDGIIVISVMFHWLRFEGFETKRLFLPKIALLS